MTEVSPSLDDRTRDDLQRLRDVLRRVRDTSETLVELGVSLEDREAHYAPELHPDHAPQPMTPAQADALAGYIVANDEMLALARRVVAAGVPEFAVIRLTLRVVVDGQDAPDLEAVIA